MQRKRAELKELGYVGVSLQLSPEQIKRIDAYRKRLNLPNRPAAIAALIDTLPAPPDEPPPGEAPASPDEPPAG